MPSFASGHKPLILVMSGPSGVGKDAVLGAVQRTRSGLYYTVNATTRPPRPGEVEGEHHFFLTEAQFQGMIARDELLEHARVYDRWYGVPKAQVREALARGQDVICRVDIQGAASVRRRVPEAVLLFVAPPSPEELERRLRSRGIDTGDQLALRIAAAHKEMEEAVWFDYVVVNETDAIERSAARVLEILDAEHARVPHRQVSM